MAAPLGIIAGGGPLPVRIVDACRRTQRPHFVVVLEGQGDPGSYTDTPHAVVRLGAAGRAVQYLRDAGCGDLVMAGTVRRPSMNELRPDWWGVKFFARSGAAALGDDGLLTALVGALENEGFNIVGADSLIPELLMPKGQLGAVSPDAQCDDVRAALAAAKALGARDIGQAAVVRAREVIAEEDKDGTDAMLRRLADANNAGGVLGKALKPDQERRVDLPTVGVETVLGAHAAGLSGIVIEASSAFLLDRGDAVAEADRLGLFLIGADADGGW